MTSEYSDEDEFSQVNPIIPCDGKEKMALNFKDDIINSVYFKEDKHSDDLYYIYCRPI